jgi:hypothetical protein
VGETLEIYLHDLKEEAQKRVLKLMGNDGNYDICPIFVLEIEDDD